MHSVLDTELDGVDPLWVKRQVLRDFRYGGIGSLVAPDRVDRAFSAGRNAVIGAVALVRTIRLMWGPLQFGHIDVFARDVLHWRIRGLPQGQSCAGIGHPPAAYGHDDPTIHRWDFDRMIRSGNLYWLAIHLLRS